MLGGTMLALGIFFYDVTLSREGYLPKLKQGLRVLVLAFTYWRAVPEEKKRHRLTWYLQARLQDTDYRA